MAMAVRLDKFLADAGAGTRSEVKKLIQKGQVQVNGIAANRPEQKLLPGTDKVLLSGKPVNAAPKFEYFLLHKPAGCVSATEDAREKTVMEYVPYQRKGLFPVGRLDKDTEGLLLITDDGELAHELLSPGKHVEKTYFVRVDGIVTAEDAAAVQKGVDIGEKKPALPARLEILKTVPTEAGGGESASGTSEILLTICEGKFHQVKRMLRALGKNVTYLKRISMGPLVLPDDLPKGQCRPLTAEELHALKQENSRSKFCDKKY